MLPGLSAPDLGNRVLRKVHALGEYVILELARADHADVRFGEFGVPVLCTAPRVRLGRAALGFESVKEIVEPNAQWMRVVEFTPRRMRGSFRVVHGRRRPRRRWDSWSGCGRRTCASAVPSEEAHPQAAWPLAVASRLGVASLDVALGDLQAAQWLHPEALLGAVRPPGAMMIFTFMPFFALPPPLRANLSPVGLVPPVRTPPADLCRPFKVFARFARFASVGFEECEALASFFAGIFSPCGTCNSLCSAPGCLIAPAIQLPPPDARCARPPMHFSQRQPIL